MANMAKLSDVLLRNCLTLPDERLLLAKRKHWLAVAIQIVMFLVVATIFLVIAVAFFTTLFPSFLLAVVSVATIFLFSTTLITKCIVDWYCHLYIVTTHRILELCHVPLFSDHQSDVLLDQLRVTEIDVKKEGVVAELLNIGAVTITFDRPTHQEMFMLIDIEDPEMVGTFLGSALVDGVRHNPQREVWYRKKEVDGQKRIFRFTEEIFPGRLSGSLN